MGHWPIAWQQCPAWTILDTTGAELGPPGAPLLSTFLQIWQRWRSDPQRPRMLHYVGIVSPQAVLGPVNTATLLQNIPADMLIAVRDACAGVAAGFNRLLFDSGQVSLTLCVGELKPMLAEQAFAADMVLLGAHAVDEWHLKLVAQRCRRGTRFYGTHVRPQDRALYSHAGFEFDTLPASFDVREASGSFNPAWRIATSRQGRAGAVASAVTTRTPVPAARCAVVGAGLSGASVANALALRGWQVSVFDQHEAPAGGASGLPAGLAVPYVSADNDPRSRISRSGVRLLLHWARALLVQGQDWKPTGVQERKYSKAHTEPTLHWHADAAWVKPAALVRAWLGQPGIRFVARAQVCALRRQNQVWLLLDSAGKVLGEAEELVFANALGCVAVLGGEPCCEPLPPLHPNAQAHLRGLNAVHGTVSQGSHEAHAGHDVVGAFPAFPVNGHGSFLSGVPTAQGMQWLAGATFEVRAEPAHVAHRSNWVKLQQLLPDTAAALAPAFACGGVSAWSGTRCVSHDRMPLVGQLLEPGEARLWISAAMGARGLSFSAVCAELLVAQLCAEPLPLERSLVRSLDVLRHRRHCE